MFDGFDTLVWNMTVNFKAELQYPPNRPEGRLQATVVSNYYTDTLPAVTGVTPPPRRRPLQDISNSMKEMTDAIPKRPAPNHNTNQDAAELDQHFAKQDADYLEENKDEQDMKRARIEGRERFEQLKEEQKRRQGIERRKNKMRSKRILKAMDRTPLLREDYSPPEKILNKETVNNILSMVRESALFILVVHIISNLSFISNQFFCFYLFV